MSRDAVSGVLLIVGSLAAVVVMALHPTGHGLMNEETFAHTMHLGMFVHALAIAATPVLFLGLMGAARRLSYSDLAVASLVAFGFGSFAVMGAALASGFVFPGVIQRIVAAEGSNVPHAFLVYTSLWNQAFARTHVMAHSVGAVLLSASILKHRARLPLALSTGITGMIVGIVVPLLLLSGHVHLDVHGARIVYFLHAGWMILLGVALWMGGRAGSEGLHHPDR